MKFSNKPSETVIERLHIEHDELREKLIKLNEFIKTDFFESLDYEERVDLELQQSAMRTYLLILTKRLKRMNLNES